MRASILCLLAFGLLTACGPAHIAEEDASATGTTLPAAYPFVDKTSNSAATSTLLDVGTGCEYVVSTMYQDDIDVTPRMQRTPSGDRQICGTPRPGSTEFVVRKGGQASWVSVAVVSDRETGCQYISATMFQDAVRIVGRMEAQGDERRQMCGTPA